MYNVHIYKPMYIDACWEISRGVPRCIFSVVRMMSIYLYTYLYIRRRYMCITIRVYSDREDLRIEGKKIYTNKTNIKTMLCRVPRPSAKVVLGGLQVWKPVVSCHRHSTSTVLYSAECATEASLPITFALQQ